MLIKLVAFDVDGTLKDENYIPDTAKKAIDKLKAQGITVCLCTGRSEYEITDLRKELGVDWTITCNGSHVAYQGKTAHGKSFDPNLVQKWREMAGELGHMILFYSASEMFANELDNVHFRQAQQKIGFQNPHYIDDQFKLPDIYQCIVFCSEEEEVNYIGSCRDHIYVHRWDPWAIDFNPEGMNKSVGLRWLVQHLKLNREQVAAFGDGSNDVEMLSSVGMGIAMGNGIEKVKRVSKYITRSIHDDGVAYAVDQWILPSVEKVNG